MKIADLLNEFNEPIGAKLKVAKDDDKQTVLIDPATNTQTIIDKKKNPQGTVQKDKTGQGVINVNPNQPANPSGKPQPLKPGSQVLIKKL
jgi:hypothetical protein